MLVVEELPGRRYRRSSRLRPPKAIRPSGVSRSRTAGSGVDPSSAFSDDRFAALAQRAAGDDVRSIGSTWTASLATAGGPMYAFVAMIT